MAQVWQVGAQAGMVHSLDHLQELLLTARGVEAAQADQFFSPSYEAGIHPPELLAGMAEAVARIFQAAKDGQRILVYGDYDADGITATAILVSVLGEVGIRATPYLPHRLDDGYGLSREVLAGLLPEFDLLISADCGVGNVEEIAWLKKQGKDVIVVDHHELPPELPVAAAILHPRLNGYPFPHLSGAGVAWKLAQGLLRKKYGVSAETHRRERELLDLAALGTIADVVPVLGENRAIVRFGLTMLAQSRRPGVRALLAAARIPQTSTITARDVAFRVIPRLNAAGRMEHPQPALDVLLAESERRAHELVQRLNTYNSERQTLTKRVMEEASANIDTEAPFIFAANPAWPAGIVGLVAGRLADTFARPAIVVGGNGKGAVGSARSPEGSNVLQLLEGGRGHLSKLGGHARAAGFSLSAGNIASFRQALSETPQTERAEHAQAPVADALVSAELLSWDLLELTEPFAPYGEGNQQPSFIAQGLEVLDVRCVGRAKEHLKLLLAGVYEPIEAMGFRLGEKARHISKRVDVLCTVEANEYQGRRRFQLTLRELARAGTVRVQQRDASHSIH